MGGCFGKRKNNDNVESITGNNQQYQRISTGIINQPTSSNSRPNARIQTDPGSLPVPLPRLQVNKSKNINERENPQQLFNEVKPQSSISKQFHAIKASKVRRDIDMLTEFLQALYIPMTHIPIKRPYVEKMLSVDSKQYKFVRSQLRNKKFNDMYEINQIGQVWNPYIFLQYKIKADAYKEDTEARILFHGTHLEHLESILTNNFDWRKIKTGKFGWGVSFANNPWYASHYSTRKLRTEESCVMILARVLIGEKFYGNSSTIVPLNGDTSTNHDGQVLVKFDDACFYPEFIIYFKKRTNHPAFNQQWRQ